MAKNSENKNQQDAVWLILSIVGAIASIVSFYWLDNYSTLMKVMILLGGLVVSTMILFQSSYGLRIVSFVKETRIELLKVVWPDRAETIKMTLTIIVAVIIIGIFLWLVDAFFLWAVQALL
ncbi:Preprotein translocase subunit SecE (TC 3.A.5.1.1) [hydrothermal vent metagenome]|uniref:Preprotein translocase subunit SecE (TC 3.A.5.1.1) n=1 Tax=hydrothermal vent metagenome TaxID=652676 RepID=A0A1W1C113_9ZZZZ